MNDAGSELDPKPKNQNRVYFRLLLIGILVFGILVFARLSLYVSGTDFWLSPVGSQNALSDATNPSTPGAPVSQGNQPVTVLVPTPVDSVVPFTQLLTFQTDASLPLSGKLIFLDPGHGGKDPGCSIFAGGVRYLEAPINLTVANRTKTDLEAKGATVIMMRSDDSWVSLYNRISLTHLYCIQYADQMRIDTLSNRDKERIIRELSDTIQVNSDNVNGGGMGIMAGTGVGSDLNLLMNLEKKMTDVLYLSIHVNSNGSSYVHGTQVYYDTDESVISSEKHMVKTIPEYRNNPNFPLRKVYYGRNGSRNQLLAQSIYDAVISSEPQMATNAKSVLTDNFAVLREHNLAGVMVEVGFITNKKDRSYLSDSAYIDKISLGITEGCVRFFASDNS